MLNKIVFFILIQTFAFSQSTKISGYVKDISHHGIENASAVLLDKNKNTIAYAYSDDKGFFEINFSKKDSGYVLVVSSLGFQKETILLDDNANDFKFTIVLKEKIENIKEVVIDNSAVKIDGDTTTIKVEKFINQTEQTVEDVLKKMPGIQVLKDGSIKAHGVLINKLLVDGDDLFDKNYKLLSKNLDAKVLEEVQILDGYEDNPILKNMINSNKVALNLKIKKNKHNVWFGNVNLGAGVISENRWKESYNIGLLRKKIKFFCFGDYNNSGEKATDIITENSGSTNMFGEDRYEKKTTPLYSINSNENSIFSKSQSIINTAFLNSLSFNTKFSPKFIVRGNNFFTSDNQFQDSFIQQVYNIAPAAITFNEINNYNGKRTLASAEFEIKYFANEKNYFNNFFVYKNNPSTITNYANFNNTPITQFSKINNQTVYNHLYHTLKVNDNIVLNNYLYLGMDWQDDTININSPSLNVFLNSPKNSEIRQFFDQQLLYFGVKSKIVSNFKKIDYTLALNYENNVEKVNNSLLVNELNRNEYENNLKLLQNSLDLESTFRYNFSKKINVTGNVNFLNNYFKADSTLNNISLFNYTLSFNLKSSKFGHFILHHSKNAKAPEIATLMHQPILSSFNSFTKGIPFQNTTQSDLYSLSHSLLNDKKRIALHTTFSIMNIHSRFGFDNVVNQDFIFYKYNLMSGGKNYMANINFVNYFRKLKMSFNLISNQNINNAPVKINSDEFTILNNYSSNYKVAGNSHFSIPLNFNFGVQYNFNKTNFREIISNNKTKEAYLNLNYRISKSFLVELNNNFYQLNNTNYSFMNAIVNFTPPNNKFSFRLLVNNIANENNYTVTVLDNYISSLSRIYLIPRYALLNMKYRF